MKEPTSTTGEGAGPSRLTGNARGELERHVLESVKGTDRLILRELFGFLRGKAVCWPGNEALAMAAGVCPRTVSSALKRLDESEVIKMVDDSSSRSRRRIVLLAHPGAAQELARLEASPHVQFTRSRIGRPASDKRQLTLQNLQGEGCTDCKADLAKFASETVEPLNPRLESPLANGEKVAIPNGERLHAEPAPETADAIAAILANVAKSQQVPGRMTPRPRRPLAAVAGPDDREIQTRALGSPAAPEPASRPAAVASSGQPPAKLSYANEKAMVAALEAIGPGSTREECQRAAISLTLALHDGGSARFWYGVAEDVRRRKLPLAVFMGVVTDPKVKDPKRVIVARIKAARKAVSP